MLSEVVTVSKWGIAVFMQTTIYQNRFVISVVCRLVCWYLSAILGFEATLKDVSHLLRGYNLKVWILWMQSINQCYNWDTMLYLTNSSFYLAIFWRYQWYYIIYDIAINDKPLSLAAQWIEQFSPSSVVEFWPSVVVVDAPFLNWRRWRRRQECRQPNQVSLQVRT